MFLSLEKLDLVRVSCDLTLVKKLIINHENLT